MKLANKIAIVTGAGSGMGKAASLLFAAEGAKVAAVDISENQVKETAAEIAKKGGVAIAIRADGVAGAGNGGGGAPACDGIGRDGSVSIREPGTYGGAGVGRGR